MKLEFLSGISRLFLIVDAYPCLIDWCGLPVGLGWGVHDTKAFLGLLVVGISANFSSHLARLSSICCSRLLRVNVLYYIIKKLAKTVKTAKTDEGVGWNCSARVAQTPVFFFGTLQDKKTKVNIF